VNADLKTWVRAEWDRVAGIALLAVGVVVLVFGYIGVSNSTDTPEALCYVVSGGIGSLLAFGAGAVLLISADLHDEWRKLNRIEQALDRLAGQPGDVLDLGDNAGGTTAEPKPAPVLRSLSGANAGGNGRLALTDASGAVVLMRPVRFGTAGIALGGGALGLAWWRTASDISPHAAYGGVAAGIGALLLASGSGAAALAWSRRSVEQRKTAVLAALVDLPADDAEPTVTTAAASGDGWVVVADGLSEYHRPSCAALPTHDVERVRADAVPAGLQPCRLCEA